MNKTIAHLKTYIRWTNHALTRVKLHLLVGTLFGIMKVVIGLTFIIQSKNMIDMATGTREGSLWQGVAMLALLIVAQLLLNVSNSYLYTQAENLMKNNLRQRLFGKLLISPLYGRGTYHSGDLTARLEEDVRIITSNITTSLPTVVITSTQFVGAFVLLLQFDRHLAWVIVFILPIFMVVGKLIGIRLRTMTKEIRKDESRIQSHIQEGLQHSSLLRALEAETLISTTLGNLQQGVYQKILKRTRFTLCSRSVLSLGFTTGYLVAFVWGCFSLKQGTITFGIMTAFLQLVSQIQGPTAALASLIPGFIHASTSIDRLIEIEHFKSERPLQPVHLEQTPGIRFTNVDYSYPGEKQKLYNAFSYDFAPRTRTAVLGPTGTGKTTLIRMILALIEPEAGSVTLYNGDKRVDVSPDTRCNISYVPQGNTLLSGTIEENLKLANPHATPEAIRSALHIAVADFVYSLPDGLQTRCGERGAGLSEGQAQRIAIARGLLKPSSVLLLDEISASLDKDTEALLFERLAEFAADKTIILITHRMNATTYCNQVLQL